MKGEVKKYEKKVLLAGVSNASVTTIDYKDGTFTVKDMGDTSYIETGKTK